MAPTTKTQSSTRRAADALREMIFRGELAAGSDHLETELAEMLGVSRTPIREAAVMLEAQGLIEMRPRKGVRIRPVSVADMSEIYDILTALESLAAKTAALQGYDRGDLAPLAETIDRMEAALARDDRASWALADDDFHAELVRLGRNSRVRDIVAMMSDQVRRARAITLHLRPKPTQSNADHRGVLEAIAAGDAATAQTIHSRHRAGAKAILIALLERHQLRHF